MLTDLLGFQNLAPPHLLHELAAWDDTAEHATACGAYNRTHLTEPAVCWMLKRVKVGGIVSLAK